MFSYNMFANITMKVASLATTCAVVLSVIPVGAFSTAYAATYTVGVDVPVTISGLTVTLTGTGEGLQYAGQVEQHDVQVNWGNGTVDNTSTVNFVDPPGNPKDFSGTWTNAITYAASGVYTIIVKLYHQTVPGNESSGDAVYSFDITIPEPDACPNVPGNQQAGPCADQTCVAGGGLWNGTTCVPDACPLVAEHQVSGPCANDVCIANGGLWQNNQCIADSCPLVTGHQTETPCANDLCVADGGVWENNQCTPDACPSVSGFQAGTPCANQICVDAGGTWENNQCTMPVDVCPLVDGLQTSGECANDTCVVGGGVWENNQCVPDACPLETGHQANSPCLNDACVGPFTWNTQAQTCDAPPCPEGQIGSYPNCVTPEPEVCPEGMIGVPPVCIPVPVDACPGDIGFQLNGPCSNEDVCPNDEGIQTDTEDCTQDEVIDVCPNIEGTQESVPEGMVISDGNCVTAGGGGGGSGSGGGTDPVDMCPNLAGTQEMVPAGHTFSNGQCIPPQSSGGGSTDTPATTTPAVETPAGEVLGESCEPLLSTFMREGKKNDAEEVKKLQSFLNTDLGSTLDINGVFGPSTTSAVNEFQVKYSSEILAPWVPFGLKNDKTATGYVYKTTQRWINKLHCASLDIPMPQLQ